ncbi:MAG: aldo/keto reductase [Alphaproteobacteria bacterium]|nr:aldo/keto reductase [Alphaproteobacteria bacterium]
MDYTTLGRTGLKVSVAGLGSGGPSRIGQGAGLSNAHGVALIRRAFDLGVNFFDTAESYGTEEILGAAMKDVPRDSVILSTKYYSQDASADRIVQALDDSLRNIGTDYLDIFHLHGVLPEDYDRTVDSLVPALMRERERGKFRFLGITERTSADLDHVALTRALGDDCWDVMMVSFNLMHQGARARVLPKAKKRNLGTVIMAPARCRVSTPDRLAQAITALAEQGALPPAFGETDDPLGFLVHEGGADSLMDAAYRFARHETGADVVLFGTGDLGHLEANIASLLKPPLPKADVDRLATQFGHLKGIGLDQGRGYQTAVP